MVIYNGLRDPKIYKYSLKEEFASVLCCDILLAGDQYNHLKKFIHDYEYTAITMLSRRKAR